MARGLRMPVAKCPYPDVASLPPGYLVSPEHWETGAHNAAREMRLYSPNWPESPEPSWWAWRQWAKRRRWYRKACNELVSCLAALTCKPYMEGKQIRLRLEITDD